MAKQNLLKRNITAQYFKFVALLEVKNVGAAKKVWLKNLSVFVNLFLECDTLSPPVEHNL